MLTKRRKQVLDFIEKYLKKHGYAPSLEEMAKHLKLRSIGTVHEHLQNLEAGGYLKKEVGRPRALDINKAEPMVKIRLLGTIAAGQPIEAIESREQISVPRNMLSRSGKHYALKVCGDSMMNEGIFDGDTIIVHKQEIIENGETAVALINNDEATVKKIYFENKRFRLQPANPAFKPIFAKSLTIQGKVVGVLRNY